MDRSAECDCSCPDDDDDGELPVENAWLGLYLLVMALAGTFGIGFAFAALTLRIKETAQTVANFLQFALLVLCANFFPSLHCPRISYFSRACSPRLMQWTPSVQP